MGDNCITLNILFVFGKLMYRNVFQSIIKLFVWIGCLYRQIANLIV